MWDFYEPSQVNSATHSRIASFIWGIADDVLRDLYVRGKYREAAGQDFYNTSPFALRDPAVGQQPGTAPAGLRDLP